MTRSLSESESQWPRSLQTTIAMAGWVSGLFFAKTKLPLSGGEEESPGKVFITVIPSPRPGEAAEGRKRRTTGQWVAEDDHS